MGVTLRSIIIAAMLTVLAALLYHFSNLKGRLSNEEISNLYPSFVAKGLQAELYDQDGNITHSMTTDELIYHENKQLLKVTGIDGVFYDKNTDDTASKGWIIKAQEGVMVHDNYADLRGNVTVSPLDKNTSEIKQVSTKSVHFDIKNKIISSKQQLSIEGTNFTNTGSNYKIDLNKKTIVIKDKPHVVYNP